jgi:hypothetical protein
MLGIRAPAAGRARPQGGRAGGRPESVRQRQCFVYSLPSLPHPVEKVRNPARFGFVWFFRCTSRHPGQAGDLEIVPSGGAKRVSSDIGNILGKVGEARLEDHRRSIRKAAFGRRKPGIRGLWVRPVFSARVRAHAGRTFVPYPVQEFYPICGPDATPIRTFPPAPPHPSLTGHPVRFPRHVRDMSSRSSDRKGVT